ncbi:hypothetical protein KWG60_003862 [Escherichia coli]|nr:hypothetical protein [Escherichia coli]
MKLVFVPLKDVFKECKGKRQFSIKKDAYRRFSSVSNEMQIGIKKIAALHAIRYVLRAAWRINDGDIPRSLSLPPATALWLDNRITTCALLMPDAA